MIKTYHYDSKTISELLAASAVICETKGLPSEIIVKEVFANMVLVINQLTKELRDKK